MEWRLLSSLSEQDRRALLARCQRQRYPKGGFVFHEGETGDSAHLIDSGTVAVRVTGPSGDLVTLDVLRPGDVFGEQALIDEGSVRSATVVALERTETMRFHRREFEVALGPSPRRGHGRGQDARIPAAGHLEGAAGRPLPPGRHPGHASAALSGRRLRHPCIAVHPADPGRPGHDGRDHPPDGATASSARPRTRACSRCPGVGSSSPTPTAWPGGPDDPGEYGAAVRRRGAPGRPMSSGGTSRPPLRGPREPGRPLQAATEGCSPIAYAAAVARTNSDHAATHCPHTGGG